MNHSVQARSMEFTSKSSATAYYLRLERTPEIAGRKDLEIQLVAKIL